MLPSEITPNPVPHARKIVAWALALLLVFDVAAYHYLKHFSPNKGYFIAQQKWELLNQKKQAVDWLFVGDSSGNQGINTKQFAEAKNASALNLCTIGSMGLQDDLLMLNTLIERDQIPKHVVMVHVYDVWYRTTNAQAYALLPTSTLWAIPSLSTAEKLGIAANKYAPLYAQNTSLQKVLLEPGRYAFKAPATFDESGFMASTHADTAALARDLAYHQQLLAKKSLLPSAENMATFCSIVQLADAHNIKLHVVNAPVYQELAQEPNWQKATRAISDSLRKGCTSSAGLGWHLTNPFVLEATYMESTDHVTTDGAARYTEWLTKELND